MMKFSLVIAIFTAFLVQYTRAQDFAWAKHFREISSTSPGEQYVSKVLVCPDKGVLICGRFDGGVDFNPGPQDTILYSASILFDGFIVKLDSLGNLDWISRTAGYLSSGIDDISIDDQGNVYSTGFVRGNGTLDVGGGNVPIGTGSWNRAFVMKHSADGTFLWSQIFNTNGTNASTGYELLVVSNKLFLAGKFEGDLNVNPSGSPITISSTNGTHFLVCLDTSSLYNWSHQAFSNGDDGITLTADSSNNIYYTYTSSANTILKKFDISGNILLTVDWGSAALVIEDLALDHDGGIYLTGYAEGGAFTYPSYDLNPGSGVYTIPAGIFYARLDQNGNFYSGKHLNGSMYNDILYSSGFGIAVDDVKNMYLTGRSRIGSISGNNSAFIHKYDSLGNEIWTKTMGSTYDDYGLDIVVDDDLSIFASGAFDCTVDFNPGIQNFNMSTVGCQDAYSEDGYLLKWEQDTCDHLGISIDSVSTASCLGPGFVEAHGFNSAAPYMYSWDGGAFSLDSTFAPTTGGTHTLIVKAANQCERTRDFHVPGPTILGIDNRVNSVVKWRYIPDGFGRIVVDAYNAGCTPSSGQITLVMPQNLIYDSTSIAPDFIIGDTLIWNFTNMDYQSPHFITQIYYTGDTLIQLGDIMCHPVWITDFLDVDTTNNMKTICRVAETSYDPNEKYAYPDGECIPNYIDTAQRLTYTVMFQNTGTSEAINVNILDTINPYLDINSIEVVATSHTMVTEILPNDVLKFKFENIHLPDSTTNFLESSGYVVFEISQKDTVPNNSVVTNSADIFFDYNAPVRTGQVLHTVVDVIPAESNFYYTQTACDSLETYGSMFYTSGVYPITLSNFFGCDSSILMDLTMNQSTESFINQTVCEQYVIDGVAYTNSGNYSYYSTNAQGCDSLIHLDLIVLNSSSNVSIDTCSSIDFNGVTYTSSGVYVQVIPNALGCDSTITLDLQILDADGNIGVSACDSVQVNGVSYSTSGSYQQILTSMLGCDSLLLIDVEIEQSSLVQLSETSCDSYTFNGITYNQTGLYYQYLSSNSVGCDSVVALDLIIEEDVTSTIFLEGLDSIDVNGQIYYNSGSYSQTIPSSAGCDSVINIHLSIGYTNILENEMNISVAPNPTSGLIYVTGTIATDQLSVRDAIGRQINVEATFEPNKIIIDLSNVSNGIYYLVLESFQPIPIIKD